MNDGNEREYGLEYMIECGDSYSLVFEWWPDEEARDDAQDHCEMKIDGGCKTFNAAGITILTSHLVMIRPVDREKENEEE